MDGSPSRHFGQKGEVMTNICQWFAMCGNTALTVVKHPFMGPLHVCSHCLTIGVDERETIEIGHPDHLYTKDTEAQIDSSDIVTNSCAVTIASWFASSGTVGIHFAELATSGTVKKDALLRSIDRETSDWAPESLEYRALGKLAQWAVDR